MSNSTSRSGRRPPRSEDDDHVSTDESFPAAHAEDEIDTIEPDSLMVPDDMKPSPSGFREEEDTPVGEELNPTGPADDALVFDGDPAAEENAGETFVGELPLDDDDSNGPLVEKTEILSVPTEGDSKVPVLTIETPDGQVSDVDIMKDKFILGRAPDCDAVIPDSLVSRHHSIVEKREDGWYIVDQNSGNGTYLNDERIREELLYDGDVIGIGDAVATFLAPGTSADQAPRLDATQMLPQSSLEIPSDGTGLTSASYAPASNKRKKLILIGVMVVALIAVAVVVKLVLVPPKPQGPTKQQIAAQAKAKAQAEARTEFEKVKKLAKGEQWKEALVLVAKVAAVLPEDKTVKEYKENIEMEAAAEKSMETAQALMDKKDFEGAMAALTKISSESSQAEDAEKIKKVIDDALLTDKLDKARKALDEKQWDDALAVADSILMSFPDNEIADEIKTKAEEGKSKSSRPTKKGKKHHTKKPKPKAKPKYLLMGQALASYKSEKLDDALSQASSSGVSADGVKVLRRFQSFYKQGMEWARNSSESPKAIKFLIKAVALDKKLSGGRGKLTDTIRKKLAKVYFLQGVDAHTRKKFPLAYSSFRSALKYNSGLNQARKRLGDLEIEAKKLYETAYVIKGSSPEKAISTCKTVMGMVKKKNIYYSKCKKLTGRIRGPMGDSGDDSGGF